MANLTGSYETYEVEGMRDDLGPIVFNIDPIDTPFMNSIARGTATQIKHEWQTDNLDTADFNAVDEGNESGFDEPTPTVRPNNYLQISEKTLAVTETLKSVTLAGRSAEVGYQLARQAKSLKRDCEFTLTRHQDLQNGAADGGAGSERQLASFENWIWGSTADRAASGGDCPNTAGTPNEGAVVDDADVADHRALQEHMLQGVLQACWTNGGDIDLVMTGPFNKRVISGFAGNSTRYDIGEDKSVTASISVYISDYGTHRIVANRFSRDRTVLCVDTAYWAMTFLRPFKETPLAKTGDSEKRLMNVEYTLSAYNAASSGVVADLTTS